jgi:hypothetical protein
VLEGEVRFCTGRREQLELVLGGFSVRQTRSVVARHDGRKAGKAGEGSSATRGRTSRLEKREYD